MRSLSSGATRATTTPSWANSAASVFVVLGQLVAFEGGGAGEGETDLPGDGGGGRGMVTREHHQPDAGGPARGHGVLHTGARRVVQPDQAEEVEVDLHLVDAAPLVDRPGDGSGRHRDDPQAPLRHRIDHLSASWASTHSVAPPSPARRARTTGHRSAPRSVDGPGRTRTGGRRGPPVGPHRRPGGERARRARPPSGPRPAARCRRRRRCVPARRPPRRRRPGWPERWR